MNYLVYQKITTQDGTMYHLNGPEVGRLHRLTLLRNGQVELTLQENMVIVAILRV